MSNSIKIATSFAFLALLILALPNIASAQQNFYKYRVGAAFGVMNYYGDLADGFPKIKHYSPWAYGVSLERSFSRTFGFKVASSYGKITYNDRTLDRDGDLNLDAENFARGLNFETKIWDVSGAFTLYPDNGKFLSEDAFIAPYISLGFGATHYTPYADLLDENGNSYNLSDPTQEQDEDFETELRPLELEGEAYNKWTMHIPFGVGFKIRFTDRFNLNVETNVKYTFTDYLDDVSKRGADNDLNDFYSFTAASLHYNFGFKEKTFKAPPIITDIYTKPEDASTTILFPDSEIATARVEPVVVETAEVTAEAKKADDGNGRVSRSVKKQAKKACRAACKTIESKKEREECLRTCNKREGYEAYLPTKEEKEADAPVVETSMDSIIIATPIDTMSVLILPSEETESRLDSLEAVIAQEQEIRDAEKAAKTEEVTEEVLIQEEVAKGRTGGTVPGNEVKSEEAKSEGSSVSYFTPTVTAPQPPTEIVLPQSGSGGVNEGDIRSALNERDLQDLKLQLEVMKLQQQMAQQNNAVSEMYKLEADRLRQQNTEIKLLNKMDEMQREMEMMKKKMYRQDMPKKHEIHKEIIIEMDSTAVKSPQVVTKSNANTEADEYRKIIEELQQKVDALESTPAPAATPAQNEGDVSNEQLKQQLEMLEQKLEKQKEEEEKDELRRELDEMKRQLEQQKNGNNDRSDAGSETDELRSEIEALKAELKKKTDEPVASANDAVTNDELLAEIRRLKRQLKNSETTAKNKAADDEAARLRAELDALKAKEAALEKQLKAEKNAKASEVTPVVTKAESSSTEVSGSGRPLPKVVATSEYLTAIGGNYVANIYFDKNSAIVRPQDYDKLKKVAQILNDHKEAVLTIKGYTDSNEKAAFDLKISQLRAEAVKRRLIDSYFAPSDKIYMIPLTPAEKDVVSQGSGTLSNGVELEFLR